MLSCLLLLRKESQTNVQDQVDPSCGCGLRGGMVTCSKRKCRYVQLRRRWDRSHNAISAHADDREPRGTEVAEGDRGRDANVFQSRGAAGADREMAEITVYRSQAAVSG